MLLRQSVIDHLMLSSLHYALKYKVLKVCVQILTINIIQPLVKSYVTCIATVKCIINLFMQNVKQFYQQQDAEYGPCVEYVILFQHEVDVEIFNPQVLEWTVVNEHMTVSNKIITYNLKHNTMQL